MTTILPGRPVTLGAPTPAARPVPAARLVPATVPAADPRARTVVPEALAGVALVLVVPALFVNWVHVYVQFFGAGPDLTPATLGMHRFLVLVGLLSVVVMTVTGAARGGRRWAVAAAVVFATTVSLFRVEGAIPGF